MKQITITFSGGISLAGINDNNERISPPVSDYMDLIEPLADRMEKHKTEEQIAQDVAIDHLKQTGSDEQLIKSRLLFPEWSSLIGIFVATGEVLRHGDKVIKVTKGLDVYEHQPPELLPAHYSIINPPDEPNTPIEWTPGTYAKGVIVTHNGKTWESGVDFNHWEPGATGVYESIWKDITD